MRPHRVPAAPPPIPPRRGCPSPRAGKENEPGPHCNVAAARPKGILKHPSNSGAPLMEAPQQQPRTITLTLSDLQAGPGPGSAHAGRELTSASRVTPACAPLSCPDACGHPAQGACDAQTSAETPLSPRQEVGLSCSAQEEPPASEISGEFAICEMSRQLAFCAAQKVLGVDRVQNPRAQCRHGSIADAIVSNKHVSSCMPSQPGSNLQQMRVQGTAAQLRPSPAMG